MEGADCLATVALGTVYNHKKMANVSGNGFALVKMWGCSLTRQLMQMWVEPKRSVNANEVQGLTCLWL